MEIGESWHVRSRERRKKRRCDRLKFNNNEGRGRNDLRSSSPKVGKNGRSFWSRSGKAAAAVTAGRPWAFQHNTSPFFSRVAPEICSISSRARLGEYKREVLFELSLKRRKLFFFGSCSTFIHAVQPRPGTEPMPRKRFGPRGSAACGASTALP